jgi:hypothetical protein
MDKRAIRASHHTHFRVSKFDRELSDLRVFARNTTILFAVTILKPSLFVTQDKEKKSVKMAPSNLPSIFNATSQDIETLLAAQCHLGSKNLQVHMENYLWKTRQDGVNVINVGKTWYV